MEMYYLQNLKSYQKIMYSVLIGLLMFEIASLQHLYFNTVTENLFFFKFKLLFLSSIRERVFCTCCDTF